MMDDTTNNPTKKPWGFRIPKRWIMLVVLVFGITFSTVGRLGLPTAMEFIVKPVQTHDNLALNSSTSRYCKVSFDKSGITTLKLENYLYAWDASVTNKISVSFLLGYMISQFAGGVYADMKGGRRLSFICFAIQSVLHLICPLLIKYCSGKWQLLLLWNLMLGSAQGPILPIFILHLGQWFPVGEKTFTIALANAGMMMGYLCNTLMAQTIILKTGDWSILFYISGATHLILCLFWYCFCFQSPELHPTITEQEKTMLRKRLGPYVEFKNKKIPFGRILTSLPVWAFFCNYIGLNWAWSMITSSLQTYIKLSLQLTSVEFTYLFGVSRYLGMILIDCTSALLCDILIKKSLIEVTTLRKIFSNLGCMGFGIFSIAITYAGCNLYLVKGLYITTLCFEAVFFTANTANVNDIAPNFAGTIRSLGTILGSITALIFPVVSKTMIQQNDLDQWKNAFWVSLLGYIALNTIFAVACSGEEQSWNVPPEIRKKVLSEGSIS